MTTDEYNIMGVQLVFASSSIPSQASHPIVEQLPVGIFRKDAAGCFVFVNARFCQLMDSTADQILGRTIAEIAAEDSQNPKTRWQPELVTQARLHHALIMQTGQQVEREETHSCLGSRPQHVQVVESAVLSPEKTIEGSQGVLVDITQRMQTDGTLANERDLLRALLDNSPDHICFKDTQSRFIRSSTTQALQFGMKTADGLVGKSDFDVFSEAHARAAFEDEQEIIRTGVPIVGKVVRETWIDGRSDTWALTTKIPLRNRDGEIIGTFGTSKNMSELKEAQTRIEEVQAQLLITARMAGMAEIATNVLHNVGNVLNSVNVSAGIGSG